jgi:hypothetical protein
VVKVGVKRSNDKYLGTEGVVVNYSSQSGKFSNVKDIYHVLHFYFVYSVGMVYAI